MASCANVKLANVTPKTESDTRKWLGAALLLEQHKKLAPRLEELVRKKVGKMREHLNTVNPVFIDDVDRHLQSLKEIHACSTFLQTHMLKSCEGRGKNTM